MAGARVEEIAANAGLTMGAVYSNFATKADLLLAMFDDVSLTIATSMMESVSLKSPSLQSYVEAAGDLFRRIADEEPDLLALKLELFGYVLRDPDARERRVEKHRSDGSQLGQQLEAVAAASGERLPMPAGKLAEIISATLWSLALSRAWLGKTVITDDIFALTARQLCASPAI